MDMNECLLLFFGLWGAHCIITVIFKCFLHCFPPLMDVYRIFFEFCSLFFCGCGLFFQMKIIFKEKKKTFELQFQGWQCLGVLIISIRFRNYFRFVLKIHFILKNINLLFFNNFNILIFLKKHKKLF
jgi:hypothetical protein